MDFGMVGLRSFSLEEESLVRDPEGRQSSRSWPVAEGTLSEGNPQESREDSGGTHYASACSHFQEEESSQSATSPVTPQNADRGIDPEQSDERGSDMWSNAAVTSHSIPFEREMSDVDVMPSPFLMAVGLQVGQIFAKKYRIERSAFPEEKPDARFAIEMSTGKRVFLKFFPNAFHEFKNAVKMHQLLQESPHVCRLLESVKERGYPPCLVLERGDYTLAERLVANPPSMIKRQSVLYEILQALEYIHGHDVTHGRLEPEKIMWFSADATWKLIDLKCAAGIDDWTLVSDVTGKYAAPEVRYAERHGRQRILREPEADMWSFGVIALETLTGRTFVDSKSVQRCISSFIWASNSDAECDHRWLFADPGGRRSGSDEQRYHRFLRKLLCKSPKDRISAADALGEVLFRNVEALWQRSNALVQSSHNAIQSDPFLRAVVSAQLRVDTKVELFSRSSSSDEPFHLREGYRAYTEDDEELENKTIYILRLGECFRLHLTISYAEGCQLPIQNIESVAFKTRKNKIVPLKQHILSVDHMQFEAVAFVDPTIDSLKEPLAICPACGTVNERYRKMTLQLKFRVGDDPDSSLVKNCELYFLVVRSGRKLRRYGLARSIRQRWSKLPKPAKQTIRLIYNGICKAVECVLP